MTAASHQIGTGIVPAPTDAPKGMFQDVAGDVVREHHIAGGVLGRNARTA